MSRTAWRAAPSGIRSSRPPASRVRQRVGVDVGVELGVRRNVGGETTARRVLDCQRQVRQRAQRDDCQVVAAAQRRVDDVRH